MMQRGLMILLILLSICDLCRKRLPIILLMMFLALALWQFGCEPFEAQLLTLPFSVVMLITCLCFYKKGCLGGGDVWVLSVLTLIWPIEIFGRSVCNGLLLAGLIAAAIWIYTKDQSERVPLVPFLLLGYWAGG